MEWHHQWWRRFAMGSNSILCSVAEAVYNFAHIHSRDKTTSSASAPAETQLAWVVEENLIILYRFGGAAIYLTEKVRKNTINGKKGTVKVTAAHRGNLQKELEIVQKMKRETLTNLPYLTSPRTLLVCVEN